MSTASLLLLLLLLQQQRQIVAVLTVKNCKTTSWFLLKQETVSGSGISWDVCKSAPCSRQITTPTPHHSIFTGRMPFLMPNQQCQTIEGKYREYPAKSRLLGRWQQQCSTDAMRHHTTHNMTSVKCQR